MGVMQRMGFGRWLGCGIGALAFVGTLWLLQSTVEAAQRGGPPRGGDDRESAETTLFDSAMRNSFQSGSLPPPFGDRQTWAIA